MTDKLAQHAERLRGYKMTAEEVSEQRVSFTYGNLPKEDGSTKEQVREAVTRGTVPENA